MDETILARTYADQELSELRRATSTSAALLVSTVSYLWMAYCFLSNDSFVLAMMYPVASGILAGLGWVVSGRHDRLGTVIVFAAMTVASLGAAIAHGLSLAPILAMPIVMLAGICLDPVIMLGLVLVISAALGGILYMRISTLSMADGALYTGGLALAVLAARLASVSLRSALREAWESYSDARAQRERAQRRQAQLAAALKALDEVADRLQRMNYELAQARDAAEELRGAQKQFLANVSHELRTPLALITGFSEMIYLAPESYGVPLPRAYLGDIREIYRNGHHLLGLIDDVLDLSQTRSGKMHLSRQDADLAAVVIEAVEVVRPLIEAKGLALEVDTLPALPPMYMDPTRIRQVLLNLLNNARRFTTKGSVRVAVRRGPRSVEVEVSDTGMGIAPEERTTIFQAFRRLGPPGAPQDGVGLGLTISKDFVEMHGGRIWVESEGVPGMGSAFFFTLPLDAQVEGPVSVLRHIPRGRRRAHGDAMRRRLLVIGGDATTCRRVQSSLDRYQVDHVRGPNGLASALDDVLPVAVLLNTVAGIETQQIAEVCASMGQREVPILLCTCGEEEQHARSLGVCGYLVKPITRDKLFRALDALEPHPRKLLLVDDDPAFLRLVTRMIRTAERPYATTRALNGRDGLARVSEDPPDAILLDLAMPEMDGREFLGHLHASDDLARIPVIVITSVGYGVCEGEPVGSRLTGIVRARGMSVDESLSYVGALLDVVDPPWSAPDGAVTTRG